MKNAVRTAFILVTLLPAVCHAQLIEGLFSIAGIPTSQERRQCDGIASIVASKLTYLLTESKRKVCDGASDERHFCHKECKALDEYEEGIRKAQADRQAEIDAKEAARAEAEAKRRSQAAAEAKAREDAIAEEASRKAAAEAKVEADRKTRAEGLRNGSIAPVTLDDHALLHGATNGFELVTSPKVRPDEKAYHLNCILERDEGGGIFICKYDVSFAPNVYQHLMVGMMEGNRNRFMIRVPKSLRAKFDSGARIDGGVRFVGRYTGNSRLTFTTKETRTIPSFDVLFFELPGQ